MSIEITITQKGLFKSELPFEVICGNELHYGAFDGLRLETGVIDENEFVCYQPSRIGRGFSVVWKQGEKTKVDLRLPTPAAAEEIDDFYDTVERIASVWKNNVITQDGSDISLADIPAWRNEMKNFNLRTLRDMCSQENVMTMFCAFWPLTMTSEEMARFAQAETLDGFRDYLHAKQSIDVYYAKPSFYRTNTISFGVYAFTEDTRSVFPKTPTVPFGVGDPQSGQALEVDKWYVSIGSITKECSLGQISYDDFITNIDGQSEYDALNVVIEGASLATLENLINRFRTEIG